MSADSPPPEEVDPGVEQTRPVPLPTPESLLRQNAGLILGQMLDQSGLGEFDGEDITEPRSRRQPWQPPTIQALQSLLPQYEILGFVARGGMGAVYKAVQRALQRTVAIKILPPEFMDEADLNYAERFKQEARAMARLNHPGIVAVHEAGETSGLLYIVMEFVEGTDVAQMVVSQGKLPVDLAVKIAARVCEALAYAHASGVIHRDIKPSNVMVDRNGNVKVADFGLAKMTGHDGGGLTCSDLRMGTPDFSAPESLLPGAEVDQRADIYAVGVMLYQMLTGKIPRGGFDPPSATVPKLDRRFDAIIEKAMKSDRERRYSTALQMQEALSSIKLPSPARPAAGQKWRKPALAGSCIVVLLAAATYALVKKPSSTNVPAVQTPKASLTNSLGMKFVPVPDTDVLFCIHETRFQDFAAFAAAVPGLDDSWRTQQKSGIPVGDKNDHPACGINWHEATAFCAWLSQKENRHYRLPTDREWSAAVDLDREVEGPAPALLSNMGGTEFPWGPVFPPLTSELVGNYADTVWHAKFPTQPGTEGYMPAIEGYSDGFATTSPVMSFKPNKMGIFDLGGNVWEWCQDWMDAKNIDRVTRGGSWNDGKSGSLTSRRRGPLAPSVRRFQHGFRIVLVSMNEGAKP